MFLGHQHMFLGFFLMNIYLFPVVTSCHIIDHWLLSEHQMECELLEAKYGNMNSANHEEDDGVTFPLR
jgi:hypothetical protein